MEVLIVQVIENAPDECQVDERREQWEQYLEDERVGQREQAHGAAFRDCAAMFEDRLQYPERPAETLAHQPVHIDGRLGEGQRAVFIDHRIALLQQVHREVGVFGDGVGVIATAVLDGSRSPRSNGAGYHHYDVEQIERATLEVLAGDVFERLPARPQVDAIAYLGIACYGANLRIREMAHQVGYSIVGDHAIGIDADVDIFLRAIEREVERIGLAAIGLGQHGQATRRDIRWVGISRGPVRIVLRSVVDHDDSDVLVVRHHHRADRANDHFLLVVRGDQHRNPGGIIRASKVLALAETIDDGENSNDDQSRTHQDVAHEEDRDHEVIEERPYHEGNGVDSRLPQLTFVQRRHHLGTGLTHQLRDRNDRESAIAQCLDKCGESSHRHRAIASAIVQQND